MLTADTIDPVRGQLFLRYRHISSQVGDRGALLQTDSTHNALVAESSLRGERLRRSSYGDDLLSGHILVWP
jgi:hypothetical protein